MTPILSGTDASTSVGAAGAGVGAGVTAGVSIAVGGVDTMTAGITIGFAMECFEKGLIDRSDTEGIDLCFGNDEAMIAVLKKIPGTGKTFARRYRLCTVFFWQIKSEHVLEKNEEIIM